MKVTFLIPFSPGSGQDVDQLAFIKRQKQLSLIRRRTQRHPAGHPHKRLAKLPAYVPSLNNCNTNMKA